MSRLLEFTLAVCGMLAVCQWSGEPHSALSGTVLFDRSDMFWGTSCAVDTSDRLADAGIDREPVAGMSRCLIVSGGLFVAHAPKKDAAQ